jgi:hypothetical protein
MLKSGYTTSVRFSFAFLGVDERYRDVTTLIRVICRLRKAASVLSPMALSLWFHQVVVNQLIGLGSYSQIAPERTVKGEGHEDDQPYEHCQKRYQDHV